MKTIQNKDERTWLQESNARLNSLMEAYYLARRGIPRTPTKIKFPHYNSEVIVPGKVLVPQYQMEIANAFFVRLKGLYESQTKRLFETVTGKKTKPDRKGCENFFNSFGFKNVEINSRDRAFYDEFFAIRNSIAHNYGLVDEELKKAIPNVGGPYIEISHEALENWFHFVGRFFEILNSAAGVKQM
jgi:hypothetical protein